MSIAAGFLAIAMPLASIADGATSPSVLQIDPTETVVMIQKDVGPERWMIAFDRDRGTYLGNVLKDDGSPPSFVWCEISSENAQEITFRCFGADPCTSAVCPGRRGDGRSDWIPIDDAFTLPRSFFDSRVPPPGRLDPAFGQAGVQRIPVDAGPFRVHREGLLVSADGSTKVLLSTERGLEVLGLLPTGEPDASVGRSGRAVLSAGVSDLDVTVAEFTPDGRVLLAGSVPGEGVFVARLGSDGTLDHEFGRGGLAPSRLDWVSDLEELPDGRVLVVGDLHPTAAVERLLVTGAVDTNFGSGGLARAPADPIPEEPSLRYFFYRALPLADGRTLVGGAFRTPLNYITTLFAYHADGSLDPTFGQGGVSTFRGEGLLQIAEAPGDRILVLTRFNLLRVESDGQLEEAYSPPLSTSAGGMAQIAVSPAGHVYAAGGAFVPDPERRFCRAQSSETGCSRDAFAIQSFSTTGEGTPGFGERGTLTLEFGEPYGAQDTAASTLTLAPLGRVTVVGTACREFDDCDLVVLRLSR